MNKVLSKLLVTLALIPGVNSVNAAFLPIVEVNGVQWRQPVDFIDDYWDPAYWNTVSAVCDSNTGKCNGSLGGHDLTGWTWASVSEVNALFNAYLPLPLGPGPDSVSLNLSDPGVIQAISAFYSDFDITMGGCSATAGACTYGIEGLTRTAIGDAGYFGSWLYASSIRRNFPPVVSTNRTEPSFPYFGVWFYRSEVPVPATLGLFVAGLAALGFSRRKLRRNDRYG